MSKPKVIYETTESGRRAFVECPDCRNKGWIDDGQWQGKASILCEHCGYHETHDFR